MQKNNQTLPIQVYFYTAPDLKSPREPRFLKPNQLQGFSKRVWHGVPQILAKIITKFPYPLSVSTQKWKKPVGVINAPQPKIIILLLNSQELSISHGDSDGEKNLARIIHHFRQTCSILNGQELLRDFDYQPMITLGLEDLMSLYGEDEPKQDFRRDLNLDHRIKYLDSSIWNRYIPFYNDQEIPFEARFKSILGQMINWHNNQLYESVAAVTTLEFQTRMLYNSFIADVGEKGHFELVRPFKFHSETQMDHRTKELLTFFKTQRNGIVIKDWLDWNILMVDDHAESSAMSLLSPQKDSQLKKKQLILDLLEEDGLKIKVTAPSSDVAIIDQMKAKLKDKDLTYDVILLDYLLGAGPNQGSGREYGHDFLFALMQEPGLQKGPYNRFWVFPMSSFPHAFTDKLHQLGINHLSDWWHLSNGGDPVCTPELFKYNLIEFLKQQVKVCFYDEKMLADLILKFQGISDYYEWVHTINRLIKHMQAYRDQLGLNKTSGFSSSLVKFIRQQETTNIEEAVILFLEILDGWGSDDTIIAAIKEFVKKFPLISKAFPNDLVKKLKLRDKKFKIYILYSGVPEDKKYLGQLEIQIKGLQQFQNIQIFYSDKILPGDHIQDTISEYITNADLCLVLLSADLWALKQELAEMDLMLAQKKQIIPILCRTCRINKEHPISKLQYLPREGIFLSKLQSSEVETEMVKILEAIETIINTSNSKSQKKSEPS